MLLSDSVIIEQAFEKLNSWYFCSEHHKKIISGKLYEPVAKSQLKKMTKLWQQDVRKAEEKAKRDAEAEEATRKKAEEAKQITITEDAGLPSAQRTKISGGEQFRGKRVKVRIKLNDIIVTFHSPYGG